MDEKRTPQGGQITIKIVVEFDSPCNIKASLEQPQQAPIPQELTLTKSGKDKPIVLQSTRLIEAFKWLQDKTGLEIPISDMSNALGLNKDQTRKVLQTLCREKKLIFYKPTEEGKIKLIRIDDFDRLQPM